MKHQTSSATVRSSRKFDMSKYMIQLSKKKVGRLFGVRHCEDDVVGARVVKHS